MYLPVLLENQSQARNVFQEESCCRSVPGRPKIWLVIIQIQGDGRPGVHMVEPSLPFVVVAMGFLSLWVLHFSSYWHRSSKSGARLPKGSLGWPIIGETFDLVREPSKYALSRYKRYGNIFKSSLFLHKTIVGTTPEFAKFVITNSHLFNVSSLPAIRKIVGPTAFNFQDGPRHLALKRILQKPLLPEALKNQVEVLETIVLEHLALWEQSGTVASTADAGHKIMLDIGAYILFGIPNIGRTSDGRMALESLDSMSKAMAALPVNLPGTAYTNALKAKAYLALYVRLLLEQRRGKEFTGNDMLGAVIAAHQDPNAHEVVKGLSDDVILENLTGLWFGFLGTTSTTLVWLLKALGDYPDVFRRVQAEQREIKKCKTLSVDANPSLTWEDTKKMVYSQKVFNEVQRIVSVGSFVMRKAAQDVVFDGQLIPKGWSVILMYNAIHSDPTIYPNPTDFNPDRFDSTPKPYTYLPFSSGVRMCPGMDIAKLISLIFCHHVTTTYTFESADVDHGKEYAPFPTPVGGYPINFSLRRNEADFSKSEFDNNQT